MNEKTIIIDIGNSFVKIKNNEDINFIYLDDLVIDKIKNSVDLANINSAIISSVNTDMECVLVDFLASNKITVKLADTLLRSQKFIDFSNIQGMGNDRKLGLIGALSFYKPPIITIDCGTAITINILSKDSICLGGAIMCGVGTQTRALSEYASGLPAIKINKANYGIINGTEDAINTGLISAVRGGITDFLYNIFYKEKLENTNVAFTGGYSDLVFKLCVKKLNKINTNSKKINKIEQRKNLVFLGLEKLIGIM
ncbi:MAG: type III pantothenate kinase [Bacteroidetes bacterium]|nr:type III pantothenate kinase [Bacteroidota bacterium]